jgi:hypothetical protein
VTGESLGKQLVREAAAAGAGPVEASAGGLTASADVVGAGPYGAEVRGVQVSGGSRPVGEVVDALAGSLDFLPEPIEPFEVGAARGVLRTRRDRVRDREYYEVVVEEGAVDVGRFRGRSGGGRDRLSENLGHRSLERLVDAVADAWTEPEENRSRSR